MLIQYLLDTAFLIDDPNGDHEVVKSNCQAHCQAETDLKSFFCLKRRQMFSYSCICLSTVPGDSGVLSEYGQAG